MDDEKQIRWVGSAYDDLLAFPKDARKEAGFQLGKVQAGLEPAGWKPFDEVGAGTREIRIREASGIYRVMYVQLLVMRIDLHVGRTLAQEVQYFRDAIERVQAVPGVLSAGAITGFLRSDPEDAVQIEGRAPQQ